MVEKDGKIDEIRKLSAKDRIQRLRELEERNKREIQEAEKLISESKKEVQVNDLLEKINVSEKEEVESDKSVDSGIEGIIEKEPKKDNNQELENSRLNSQYKTNLKEKTTPQLYQNLSQFQKDIIEKGYANQEERKRIEEFGYELKRREDSYKAAQERASETFVDSKGIVNYMRKFLR